MWDMWEERVMRHATRYVDGTVLTLPDGDGAGLKWGGMPPIAEETWEGYA